MDRVWRMIRDMVPVVVGLSITQLNSVLDSLIAWSFTRPAGGAAVMPLPGSPLYPLNEGTATALYLGQRLYQFPLGVFGVALGTVLFPLLTSHAQRGEIDKLRADMSLGLRLVIAIGVPASLGLMLISDPLANLFFRYGKFDAEAARMTGTMISAYSSGVWAYCGLLIVQRGFYAVSDRVTPMKAGFVAMLANLTLNLTVIWSLGGRGLALSTAIIASVQCVAVVLLLQQKIGSLQWREIGKTSWKTVLASGVMCLVHVLAVSALAQTSFENSRVIRLVVPLVSASLAYLASSAVLGLSEPWQLMGGARRPAVENPPQAPNRDPV
jgi:putative peptidoglycan lipid II flippase